jgi:hypothetical protein
MLHGIVKQLDILLRAVPTLESLAHATGIHLPLGHVRRHVLIRTQDGDRVDDSPLAFEIHHGNVEVHADLWIRVAVESEISNPTIF